MHDDHQNFRRLKYSEKTILLQQKYCYVLIISLSQANQFSSKCLFYPIAKFNLMWRQNSFVLLETTHSFNIYFWQYSFADTTISFWYERHIQCTVECWYCTFVRKFTSQIWCLLYSNNICTRTPNVSFSMVQCWPLSSLTYENTTWVIC